MTNREKTLKILRERSINEIWNTPAQMSERFIEELRTLFYNLVEYNYDIDNLTDRENHNSIERHDFDIFIEAYNLLTGTILDYSLLPSGYGLWVSSDTTKKTIVFNVIDDN